MIRRTTRILLYSYLIFTTLYLTDAIARMLDEYKDQLLTFGILFAVFSDMVYFFFGIQMIRVKISMNFNSTTNKILKKLEKLTCLSRIFLTMVMIMCALVITESLRFSDTYN